MTFISTVVVAATPSLVPVLVADAPMLKFAAMFDVEMAVSGPAVPMVIKGAAGAEPVAPPTAAAPMGLVDLEAGSEDDAAPDVSQATISVTEDGHFAVIHSFDLVLGLSAAIVPVATQLAPAAPVATAETCEGDGPPIKSPVIRRASLQVAKPASAAAKTINSERLAEPMAAVPAPKTAVMANMPLIVAGQQSAPMLDHVVPVFEGGRALLAANSPINTPVERLLAALSRGSPAERQWLDTVIRDVASVAVRSGDIRFRVEPEGYGRMTIERTADRLEISVTEARSMVVAEAARPHVLAGAAVLGVPVAGATVVLDQPGQRGREEARQRQQIEHRNADEASEDNSADIGRYA